MKVNEAHPPTTSSTGSAAAATALAPQPVEAAAPPAPVDRVTIDDAAAGMSGSTSRGIDLAAADRAVRLASLARAIRAGTYRPSAMALAEQMLAAADLDARLSRLR